MELAKLVKENKVDCLQGEEQQDKPEQIIHLCQFRGQLSGDIIYTNYRFIFQSTPSDGRYSYITSVPYSSINKVSKSPAKTTQAKNLLNGDSSVPVVVEIECKDFRSLKFDFTEGDSGRKGAFHNKISQRAFTNVTTLFCFKTSNPSQKWFIYDPVEEFERQSSTLGQKCEWKTTDINQDFSICDTYPQILVVPKMDFHMNQIAAYRSRNRLPVATWLHPCSGAALVRCSQPLVGLKDRRSGDDYIYLKHMRDLRMPETSKLLIFDCRPKLNAQANRTKGGGFESHESYCDNSNESFIERVFCDIENIHEMRDSQRKIIDALGNHEKKPDKKWFELLNDSKWMQHMRLILIATNKIVDRMHSHGHSCIVHCSDGWDRTAQVAAIAQICLDGYYRTLRGFLVLVDKEWMAFGHKFQDRVGHTVNKPQDSERSPVFIQFLDCVYQVMVQFPGAFEFSERLLIFLAESLFSAQFGNFLFNNMKERLHHSLDKKTGSAWNFILQHKDQYIHPIYDPSNIVRVLIPQTSVMRLTFWIRLYAKYDPRTPRDHLLELALQTKKSSPSTVI